MAPLLDGKHTPVIDPSVDCTSCPATYFDNFTFYVLSEVAGTEVDLGLCYSIPSFNGKPVHSTIESLGKATVPSHDDGRSE